MPVAELLDWHDGHIWMYQEETAAIEAAKAALTNGRS